MRPYASEHTQSSPSSLPSTARQISRLMPYALCVMPQSIPRARHARCPPPHVESAARRERPAPPRPIYIYIYIYMQYRSQQQRVCVHNSACIRSAWCIRSQQQRVYKYRSKKQRGRGQPRYSVYFALLTITSTKFQVIMQVTCFTSTLILRLLALLVP